MSVLFDSYEAELQTALRKAKVIMKNFHLTADSKLLHLLQFQSHPSLLEDKPNCIKDIRERIREAEKNVQLLFKIPTKEFQKAKMESEYAVAPSQMKGQFKKKVIIQKEFDM